MVYGQWIGSGMVIESTSGIVGGLTNQPSGTLHGKLSWSSKITVWSFTKIDVGSVNELSQMLSLFKSSQPSDASSNLSQ